MALKYVHSYRRTSSMNSDAENRRRNASVAPTRIAGSTHAFSTLPWNNGIAAYGVSPRPQTIDCDARTARPCVIRTAFGAPAEPDVKMRRYRSSGSGADVLAPALGHALLGGRSAS